MRLASQISNVLIQYLLHLVNDLELVDLYGSLHSPPAKLFALLKACVDARWQVEENKRCCFHVIRGELLHEVAVQ